MIDGRKAFEIVALGGTTDVLVGGGLAACVLTTLVMVPAQRAWLRLGRRDGELSLRKVHRGEVPRVGGLVLLVGFGLVLVAGLAGTSRLSAAHPLFSVSPLTGLLVGALTCGLVGLYDDLVGLRARVKLAFQLVAAALAVLYGLNWPALERLLGDYGFLAPWVVVVFLVVATNALNFLDGLDGLAGGIASIGFATILAAFWSTGFARGAVAPAYVASCALGAALGFVAHNRHPARVFMGDTGSYFLGFLLAGLLLMVEPVRWRVPIVEVSIPLMVLALPLFDVTMAVGRRFVRGTPIFASDSDHVHHRLLASGLSHRRAVLVLWLSTAMFAALGYLNVLGVGGWWTLLGSVLATLVAAVLLGYHHLLGELPAFTGERSMTWQERRREVLQIIGVLDGLARAKGGTDVERWLQLAPDLSALLARLGVPAFEIARGGATLVRAGDSRDTWAWLGFPLPETGGAELRLGLEVRLPDLRQEQLVLLERVVALVADVQPHRGRSVSTVAAAPGPAAHAAEAR